MKKGHAKVSDKDNGYAALLGRLRKASETTRLTVGIHESEGAAAAEDGATVAEIGTYHEFGLGVPQRSFIADWADETEDEHKAQLAQMAKAVVDGKVDSLEHGLERLGNRYVGEVQKRIAEGIEPELAESTIKAKGSSVPLINTGQLRSAISFYVNDKKGSGGEGT